MPSLGSILQNAKTGLIGHQQAMNATSHNIANASTDGYSRQRANMVGGPPVHLPQGVFGTGVRLTNVQRIADPLLERAHFRELGGAGEHETRAGILRRVEGLFNELSDTGLGAALDGFFSSWSDLASDPSSTPARAGVRQAGAILSGAFQELASGLDTLRQEVDTRMDEGVDRINAILRDVADLNQRIVSHESGGGTVGDLRDERGRRLEELADLIPIDVVERESGAVGVASSGINIVDGVYAMTLEARQTAGVWGLARVSGSVLPDSGGAMGGLFEVANVDLPAARQRLDDLAEAIVTEVNAVHTTGTNPAGATGVTFFDPAGTSASTIDLSADVAASLDAIAAATPDGTGGYRAGANDVALALAVMRDIDAPTLGTTFGEHYDGLVFDIGGAVRSTVDAANVHRSLANQANARRAAVSGVSVDEELVKLIEFQTGYQASARVVSTADEMLQSLLAM